MDDHFLPSECMEVAGLGVDAGHAQLEALVDVEVFVDIGDDGAALVTEEIV